MGKIFRDMFSGIDNNTIDVGRILWAMLILSFIVFTAVSVYKNGLFDYLSWSAAAAALLTSGAGALHMKRGTEPSSTDVSIKTDTMTMKTETRVGDASIDKDKDRKNDNRDRDDCDKDRDRDDH